VFDVVTNVRRPGVVVSNLRTENTDRFPARRLHSLARVDGLRSPVWSRRAVTVALAAMAVRHRVEVVHAHHGYRTYRLVGLIERLRLPLVVSLHGHDVTGLLVENPHAYERVAELTAAAVVPSRFLAGLAVAAGFPLERIHVIPSGVDTRLFAASPLPEGPPEALFVGRFVAKKGLDVLAEAWPAVRAAVPGARLRLLGFGDLEPLARSIPGAEVVLSPTRAAVRDAMRRARLVVTPSHTASDDAVESLLVVNLEAQASGRAVVTTRHGGIPEYVREGRTALVVPEGDADALAEALASVLGDEALAARLGAAGPEWVAQFDLRRTARRIDELYDEVCAAGASW
jgi:colanic acid/amylovoran biosynthesis glycosyltransferase